MKLSHKLPCRIGIAALCAVVLASCSNLRPVKLDPVAGKTRWYMGKNFVVQSDSVASVAIAFDESGYTQARFDIAVTNLSDASVLIAPEDFSYTFTTDSSLTTWKDSVVNAFDPEPKIASIRSWRNAEDDNYSSALTGQNLNAIVSGITGVVRLATDGKKSDEEKRIADSTESADRAAELAGYLQRDERHIQELESISSAERTWADALRKTTLDKGQSIHGRVLFPTLQAARGLRILIPVGDRKYTFVFRQELVE